MYCNRRITGKRRQSQGNSEGYLICMLHYLFQCPQLTLSGNSYRSKQRYHTEIEAPSIIEPSQSCPVYAITSHPTHFFKHVLHLLGGHLSA